MNLKKLALPVLILLVLAVGAAMWFSHQQTTRPKVVQTKQQASNIMGKKVSFTVTEGEQKKWIIEAAQGTYFHDTTGAKLIDVTGTFFSPEGKPVMTFKAPTGEYLNLDHQVKLSGRVQVDSVDDPATVSAATQPGNALATLSGKTAVAPAGKDTGNAANQIHLQADKVTWSAKSQIINAVGNVDIDNHKGLKSHAGACQFSMDFSTVNLQNGVSSQMSL